VRILSPNPGPRLIVNVDGAARGNPGPAGIGVSVTDEDGRVVVELGAGIGHATNNQAEYRAALAGLALAAEHGASKVLLRSDSRLLVEQLSGGFRVKDPTLRRLHEEARGLMAMFEDVSIEHVPREQNADADRMANVGIDEWFDTEEGRAYRRPEPPPTLFEG
jgi:ribonuclease HI